MPLRALFVDFNSYFASVEQHDRPELRGRPVGVVPVMADTTCCIAASYEAKRHGVKTGTIVAEAKRLCPCIELVEARPKLYVEYHHKLVGLVESCLHVHKALSIDEMVCHLEGRDRKRDNAIALAREIKRVIAREYEGEMRSSIGIAPNTFLAKTASDMDKPDGLTVLEDADLPDKLFRLKLRDLSGIGPNMEKRLKDKAGIHTVEDLCHANVGTLRAAWNGVAGERMYARLKGEWMPDLETQRSSIGHSHVLPPALREPRSAYAVLSRLTQKAAMRLRSESLLAGTLSLHVRLLGSGSWSKAVALDPTDDTRMLIAALDAAWRDYPEGPNAAPLAVGVTFFDLSDKTGQTASLFANDAATDRLNAALDRINLRYGKQTVYFGGAHMALASAPMRIAFNHIPDLKLEGDEYRERDR